MSSLSSLSWASLQGYHRFISVTETDLHSHLLWMYLATEIPYLERGYIGSLWLRIAFIGTYFLPFLSSLSFHCKVFIDSQSSRLISSSSPEDLIQLRSDSVYRKACCVPETGVSFSFWRILGAGQFLRPGDEGWLQDLARRSGCKV